MGFIADLCSVGGWTYKSNFTSPFVFVGDEYRTSFHGIIIHSSLPGHHLVNTTLKVPGWTRTIQTCGYSCINGGFYMKHGGSTSTFWRTNKPGKGHLSITPILRISYLPRELFLWRTQHFYISSWRKEWFSIVPMVCWSHKGAWPWDGSICTGFSRLKGHQLAD